MFKVPISPEWFTETQKERYSKLSPINVRGQLSLNPYGKQFHVVCPDNRIRGFSPYAKDKTQGTVNFKNVRVRGWIESTEYATFFYTNESYSNPIDIPFNDRSVSFKWYIEAIERGRFLD